MCQRVSRHSLQECFLCSQALESPAETCEDEGEQQPPPQTVPCRGLAPSGWLLQVWASQTSSRPNQTACLCPSSCSLTSPLAAGLGNEDRNGSLTALSLSSLNEKMSTVAFQNSFLNISFIFSSLIPKIAHCNIVLKKQITNKMKSGSKNSPKQTKHATMTKFCQQPRYSNGRGLVKQ